MCWHCVYVCVVGMLSRADGFVLRWTLALWCLPGEQDPPPRVLLRDWKYSHPGADQALRGRRDARRTGRGA